MIQVFFIGNDTNFDLSEFHELKDKKAVMQQSTDLIL